MNILLKVKTNIRNRRKELKLTQEDVAQKLHLQRQTYQNFEDPSQDIRLKSLEKVAEALDVDIVSLFN